MIDFILWWIILISRNKLQDSSILIGRIDERRYMSSRLAAVPSVTILLGHVNFW